MKKKKMTQKDFKLKMLEIAEKEGGDEEMAHCSMDGLMCQLLIQLGYKEGVEVFRSQEKWYA